MDKTIVALMICLFAAKVFAQTGIVESEGITSPVHRANVGRVTFVSRKIPIGEYRETDFLQNFELKETGDLSIRVFMGDSLTNYLHRLDTESPTSELIKDGNYQFSFFVDNTLIYTENLHPGAGLPDAKNKRTILSVPLKSSANEDSWGRFLWNRFMMNGGEEVLTTGNHLLRIELRPYLRTLDVKVGDLIAQGELKLTIIKPKVDEKQIAIQAIAPNSGWSVSKAAYDRGRIRELNLRIAENLYKEITSIVVIKDGRLLIEEYFNGSMRTSLNDTRSVGKSFTSTIIGIAINDGHIKSEDQQLKDFYDLSRFEAYSTKKDRVTIKSLLTMSSGFGADDNDDESPGNEEKMYPTDNWVRFALDLPMDEKKELGKEWSYFTGGVVVLGDILHRSVPGGLERYSARKLFAPLGIKNYKWEYTPQKVANTAGGLRMNSLDLARYGQLYKNGGKWNGKQIIPREWVDRSFSKQIKLPFSGDEYYGYLFWNKTFNVNGKDHEAFYATGNGGNKIFVFKDEPLVVVITAKAYGQPYAHRQVDRIMERYILPAVITRESFKQK